MKTNMYQNVKDAREQFKDIEIDVDPVYKKGVINKVYPKACYDKCWDYIIQSPEKAKMKLVHGTLITLGILPVDHAWIEIEGNILFEGVFQRFYDKDKYYAARGLVKHDEYDYMEVARLSCEYKHKGPWPK